MLHEITLLRELGLVLSELRDTTYIFKIKIDSFNFFFQRKKCLKLFGQVLLRKARLGEAQREVFQTPVGQSVPLHFSVLS